jgi:hypothetical protein
MPKRLGQSAVSLFRKTEPEPTHLGKRRPAKASTRPSHTQAPPKTEEATEKVTFLLTPSQSMYLDELCLKVRQSTGYALARTEVIRAVIKLLMGLDKVVSEQIQKLRQRGRTGMESAIEQVLAESIAKHFQRGKKG